MKNTYSFPLFLPLAAVTIWHCWLIVFCWNWLRFAVIFHTFCISWNLPRLSSGGGCDRALFQVGVSAEQQQLLSLSNLVQHINYASSKLRPAFNHFYSQFIPIMQLCCREIIVLFLELLHFSFAFSSLVFSIDVFHVLLGFFSPLNHFFFILHLIPAAQCC